MKKSGAALRHLVTWSPCHLVILLLAGGLGYAVWSRFGGPAPPGLDLQVDDAAVAQAIATARQKVNWSRRSNEAWGQLGMVFAAHDYFAQADTCYVQAERLAPREPRWFYYHALALGPSQPEASLAKLRQAVELWGEEADTPRLRLAEALLEQGQLDEASKHFLRLLRRNIDQLRAHFGLGRLAFERGDLPASLYHLRRAVASPYARRAAHLLLARVYQRQGNKTAATQELRQAAELPEDPAWPDPLLEPIQAVAVGRLTRLRQVGQLVRQDRLDEAKALLEPLLRDYPDSFQAWLWRGHVGIQQNRLHDAEQAFRTALQQAPDSAEANFMLGLTLLRQQRPDQAEPCLRRAITRKPADGNAHFELGRCLRDNGDRDGAIQALRTAVRCKPQLADAHLLLAELLTESRRDAEAFGHLRDVLTLTPGQNAARNLLHRILVHLPVPSVW
ncbi:MAG: tetratricopeptide repeat protein [Gemmataceae bacterium]|nr:tetratricopeptide repeat protein [Gemmataceae bacterium]